MKTTLQCLAMILLASCNTLAPAQTIPCTIKGVSRTCTGLNVATGAVQPGVINGACGRSNGGVFSSAPSSGLCNAGTQSAVAGTGPWAWACAGTNGGTSATCSASRQVAPISVCELADLFWNPMLATTLFPTAPAGAAGSTGTSVQFTADGTAYPGGVVLGIYDESGAPLPKDVVVSACAHDFTPVGGNMLACGSLNNATGRLALLYMPSAAQPAATDCQLLSGGTYYVNVRPTGNTTGTAHFQLGVTARPVFGGGGE